MFQKKINKDDLASIIEALNHDTIRNVAKNIGVSNRTLQRYLKNSGVYTPKSYNPNPRLPLDIEEISILRKDKMSFRRIAKRYNVCAATIFNAIQRKNEDSNLVRDLINNSVELKTKGGI